MDIRTKTLGRTGLDITVIGFGSWAIGGPWQFGWGTQDDKDSLAVIRAAIEAGVNWIDTAAAYGLGHSEHLIGQVLKDYSSADRPMVFTKCGLPWKEGDTFVRNDISPESIRIEIEESLRRLEVDVIDLYQIHWPVPDNQLEAAWEVMAKLKEQGKVRHIGGSNYSKDQLDRCEAIAAVETLQPPYSLLSRDIETDVLPWCAERNVGVLAYAPMSSGMLTGKMTRERIATIPDDDWRKSESDMLVEPKLSRNLALVDVLRGIADRYDRTPGEAAIAWVLSNPAISAAITGMRRPEQAAIIAAGSFILSDSELAEINTFLKENPEV